MDKNDKVRRNNKKYIKLLKIYEGAVNMYLAEGPIVAASEAAGETAVAVGSDNPNIKHISKQSRLGYQYASTQRGSLRAPALPLCDC